MRGDYVTLWSEKDELLCYSYFLFQALELLILFGIHVIHKMNVFV